MSLVCIAPPMVEPVALSELHDMLRIDQGDTAQDDVIGTLQVAARAWCESITKRRFVQQTWQLCQDFFPGYIDTKLTGQQISSPFVSGSNAVLVGIRFAFLLPYPPVQSLNSFVYQNANGQVTSMIIGPENISAVDNPDGGEVTITTATPHGLQTNSLIVVAGNSALLTVLLGQAAQVVTVIDANDFTIQGALGTGASIPATGTVTGYNFVADLISQPARLTPIFGQMWPVARVVVNAIQIEYTLGYATPVVISGTASEAALSGGTWTSANVGQPISIPLAGANAGCLSTIIASVVGGVASVRDVPSTSFTNVTALLITNGTPGHWELIKVAIKFLVSSWFVNRVPTKTADLRETVRCILGPVMDLRL